MLAKVVGTGSNPSGLLSYLMDSEKEYSLYGGNIAGQTYGEIMAEWKAISQQNPRTDKDTKHVTLSPHHSDRLTPEQWLDIGEFMVNGLGYTDNLWLMIKHKPTESQEQKYPDAQPHVHLMIHTFECDNFTRINDWQDQTKAEALTREIEYLWDLYQVAPSQEASQSALTTGQKRRMMRELEDFEKGLRTTPPDEPTLQKLERIVIDATSDRPDVITFVGRLQHADVDVHPTIIGDEMKGFAFEYEGFRCRGSQLKNCSWKKLQSLRGVTFNSEQDLPILQAVVAGEQIQLEHEELESCIQPASISANQIECTAMFAPNIDELLLSKGEGDRYFDDYFTAERISAREISLRRTQDQSEIVRAKWNGDNWEACKCESEMPPEEILGMIALTEHLIKEQQQRVDVVAPIVVALLNVKETHYHCGSHYTASWNEPLLTLKENGNSDPIMKASWNENNQCWIESGSKLTNKTTNYFEKKILPYVRKAIQEKQERAASSRLIRSKDEGLEL